MRKNTDNHKPIIGILLLIIILQGLFILIKLPKKERPAPVIPPKPRPVAVFKGRIAIVLDDWGYNLNNMETAQKIRYPFTAAVLPSLAFSSQAASQLHEWGKEVILHLPLEPMEISRLEKNTIMVSFDERKVSEILYSDLESIVFARGVSNHMGSRATSEVKTMRAILRELKLRNLYILDSVSTPNSLIPSLAKEMGVNFARRDIFLDNQADPEYIRGQLNKLKARSRSKGYAIGIGHDRKATLEVLAQVMPEMEREGYKFVLVSELVRK
jgi:polysaccharide deacetylase 2 family uncharacterized protein YibQ